MHLNPRMFGQPFLYDGMLVGGVVVGDQMQRFVLRRLPIDLAQKFEPLGMAVLLLALRDHTAVQHVERGEQRGQFHQSCHVHLCPWRATRQVPLNSCQPAWSTSCASWWICCAGNGSSCLETPYFRTWYAGNWPSSASDWPEHSKDRSPPRTPNSWVTSLPTMLAYIRSPPFSASPAISARRWVSRRPV